MDEQQLLPKELREYYIKKTTWIVNIGLLASHVSLGVFFLIYSADIIFLYNCLSVLVYLFSFMLLKKWNYNNSKIYIVTIFVEMYLFTILAIVCLGWKFGFQNYFIAFTSSILFIDFYQNTKSDSKAKKIQFGLFNAFLYVFLYLETQLYSPVYRIDSDISTRILFVINSLASFGFLVMFLLIYYSAIYHMKSVLLQASEKDPLTGLFNRRTMLQILNQRLSGEQNENYAIAMFDVDFFKAVNDTYGHDVGDKVLKHLAKQFQTISKENNDFWISRWGGEEFLALYRYEGDSSSVIGLFEQIRKQIEENKLSYEDVEISITVTIGLTFVTEEKEIKEWIKSADSLLYIGKKSGRNRVVV
ncbi:MAG: GGDEF domain-containing protein [Lachnospiraceae bacterium]|nr:GGDEF domain-containing protein [Lachnospiraceae bacterium]